MLFDLDVLMAYVCIVFVSKWIFHKSPDGVQNCIGIPVPSLPVVL